MGLQPCEVVGKGKGYKILLLGGCGVHESVLGPGERIPPAVLPRLPARCTWRLIAGIPSRCRQDVGGNTWKCWQGAEGLCNSDRSGAMALQLHEAARSQQLLTQRCGAGVGQVLGATPQQQVQPPCVGRSCLPPWGQTHEQHPSPVSLYFHFSSTPRQREPCSLGSGSLRGRWVLLLPSPREQCSQAQDLSPHTQSCSFLLFQELLLPAALLHPHPKPQMRAHNQAPGFPFPFFSPTTTTGAHCKTQPVRDPSPPPPHLMSKRSSKAMKIPAGRRRGWRQRKAEPSATRGRAWAHSALSWHWDSTGTAPTPRGDPGGALAPTHEAPSPGVRLGGLQHGQKHRTGSDPPAWGGSPWLSRSVLVMFSPLCPHLG